MIKTRLIKLLFHAQKYIALQVFFQWISLLCQIVSSFAAAYVIAGVYWGNMTIARLMMVVGVLVTAIALRFFFDRQSVKSSSYASLDVKRILRERIYTKLLSLGASYRQQISTGEVVQMAVEGVEQIEIYFGRYLGQLCYSLLAPVTLFIVLAPICFKAALVLLLCVPLIPVSIVAVQKIAKRLLNRYWGVYSKLGDSFLENLQGLTTLKIYEGDQQAADRMDQESEHFRKITMKVLTMQLNSTSVMDIMAYGGAAAGMVIVILEFFKGAVTFDEAIIICLLAAEFFIPMRLLGSFFHIAMNGMAASDKIFALLDMKEPEKGTETIEHQQMDIHLEEVDFSYEEERQILKDVHMEFPAGSFTALVGESGCGKSTIAGILAGRNRGYSGHISVDGKELSSIKEDDLLAHLTMVTADSYIFKGTVRENLLLGNSKATEEEMLEALRRVNLQGFLQQQQGLDTKLTEQGKNFSGGQRQRLALARALLHNTAVFIFDEATSNIDMESEEQIMKVIMELATTKTVILISHRLANVVQADRIYMLEKGRVVESGLHRQLLKEDGFYATMYNQQMALENYGKEAI